MEILLEKLDKQSHISVLTQFLRSEGHICMRKLSLRFYNLTNKKNWLKLPYDKSITKLKSSAIADSKGKVQKCFEQRPGSCQIIVARKVHGHSDLSDMLSETKQQMNKLIYINKKTFILPVDYLNKMTYSVT